METYTIKGLYGSEGNPCNVFVVECDSGCWYCVEGSHNVNCTGDIIEPLVNVELLEDIDHFTWKEPITSEEELAMAVDS